MIVRKSPKPVNDTPEGFSFNNITPSFTFPPPPLPPLAAGEGAGGGAFVFY